ncbi:YadA-like family protein [Salmonella enterica]|nr:YadA-like family protein [Salmonella enterica]
MDYTTKQRTLLCTIIKKTLDIFIPAVFIFFSVYSEILLSAQKEIFPTIGGHNGKADGNGSVGVGSFIDINGDGTTAVGSDTYARGVGNTIIGGKTIIEGDYNSGLGWGTTNRGYGNIILGVKKRVTGNNNTVIQSGTDNRDIIGDNNILIGKQTQNIWGYDNIIVGAKNLSNSNRNSIIGMGNTINGADNTLLGLSNLLHGSKTVLIGNLIDSNQSNSVVLGNRSEDRAATKETQIKLGAVTFGPFAGHGKSEYGVVSVGSEGEERQIINVASGKVGAVSTDAVNGSQLYATNVIVSHLYDEYKDGDQSTLASARAHADRHAAAGNERTDSLLAAEQKARSDGDQSTLASARAHADRQAAAGNERTDSLLAAEQKARSDGDQSTLASARAHADRQVNNVNYSLNNFKQETYQRFDKLDKKINRVRKHANAGIAGVTAMSSIPYVKSDFFSFGVALGTYRDAQALAVGIQYSPSQQTNIRINTSWGNEGSINAGIGFAAGW